MKVRDVSMGAANMSRKHGLDEQSQVPRVNSILSPSYWGSLVGLVVGIVLAAVRAVWFGPPPSVDAAQEVAGPLFYTTLVFVLLFTVRYYSAVSVNIFGGSEQSLWRWPPELKKAGFVLLATLVLLSVIGVMAIITFGVVQSVFICFVMAVLSIVAWILCYALEKVPEIDYGKVWKTYAAGDALLAIASFVVWSLVSGEPSDDTVSGFVVITGFVAIFVAVEFERRYLRGFRKQLGVLRHWLND